MNEWFEVQIKLKIELSRFKEKNINARFIFSLRQHDIPCIKYLLKL